MEQKEHLDRIVAKCRELLAVAEKRTPGRWEHGAFEGNVMTTTPTPNGRQHVADTRKSTRDGDVTTNAAFIASCAGAAEAGWRATIATIDDLDEIDEARGYRAMVNAILAAWPEELL